jgi:hypothetical protein
MEKSSKKFFNFKLTSRTYVLRLLSSARPSLFRDATQANATHLEPGSAHVIAT